MDVVFVWTDQLAEVVCAARLEMDATAQSKLDVWRSHPIGYRMPEDGDVMGLALQLLDMSTETPALESCACGVLPAAMAG